MNVPSNLQFARVQSAGLYEIPMLFSLGGLGGGGGGGLVIAAISSWFSNTLHSAQGGATTDGEENVLKW